MAIVAVPLRFSASLKVARLRELTGSDERAVCGSGTADAILLLDALLMAELGTNASMPSAADLVTSDRDRLLAAVYGQAFGDRIENTLNCASCSEPFDLNFSLRQLVQSRDQQGDLSSLRIMGQERFQTDGGPSFRFPTGRDELAVAGLAHREAEITLLNRCTDNGAWPDGPEAFQEMLEQTAPLLDVELNACCPECGRGHMVEFDVQSYLLEALMNERPRLLAEVHQLATVYRWSFNEILSLTRTERRQLVGLIDNESASFSRSVR